MKNERMVEVSLGGIEVTSLSYDGTEIILQSWDEELRFAADQDKECAAYIADENCTSELYDQIKPDRIVIELVDNGERQELSTFEIYHDDFAEFCHRNRNDEEKIDRELKRLYEDGNRFCRLTLLRYLGLLKGDNT